MLTIADYTVLLLDLDRTLYPRETGLQEAGDVLLTEWMAQTLGLSHEETNALRRRLWAEYGTSARGLEIEYGISQAEVYANSIERLDPTDYVWPRPEVRRMLAELGLPAYVFTNTSLPYCNAVLEALELADCFRGLVTIETMGWLAKPHPASYQAALAVCAAPAAAAVFVDDAVMNLHGARDCGLPAVLCHPQERGEWTPRIGDICELPQVLTGLPTGVA